MLHLVSALLLLGWAAPARAQCEVSGIASLERLRVRLPGVRLRTLAVEDLSIAVRPGRGGAYRDVRVLAPVSFAARSDARIPWTVPRATTVADGMLYWGPAVAVEDVRERDDGLVVRVEVDRGVWLSRVEVPCDAIAVGHGQGEGDVSAPEWGRARSPRWRPRGESLWLMSEPDGGATIRIDAPSGLRGPLLEEERRGGWIRLVARFSSGAMIRGWARTHHVEVANDETGDAPAFRRSAGLSRLPTCARRPPGSDEYVGPARIAAGALVHLRPDGQPWAAVSEPAVFTVSWRTGSTWVRVVHVPGLRSDEPCAEVMSQAWVPRQAVSLQGEAGMQAGRPAPSEDTIDAD